MDVRCELFLRRGSGGALSNLRRRIENVCIDDEFEVARDLTVRLPGVVGETLKALSQIRLIYPAEASSSRKGGEIFLKNQIVKK